MAETDETPTSRDADFRTFIRVQQCLVSDRGRFKIDDVRAVVRFAMRMQEQAAALTSRVEALEAEKQRADELADLAGAAHAELTRAGIAEGGPLVVRVQLVLSDLARVREENKQLRKSATNVVQGYD